jgi:chemotaxis signal transduction protein
MRKQTNESRLKKLIATNHPLLNALLVERIQKIMEITEEDIKENPEDWERSFVHPNLVHQLSNNVKEFLSDNVKENACQ